MTDTFTNEGRYTISIDQKAPLPVINVKALLSAIAAENLTELIPVYYIFLQRDLHLGSEVAKRRLQILSNPIVIDTEDKKLKAFLEAYLKKIKFGALITHISLAIPYGFSCTDMVWGAMDIEKKSYFLPKEFYAIHPRYMEYEKKVSTDLQPTLLINRSSSEKVDPSEKPQKFLLHMHPVDSGDLIDYGLMHKVIFTALIKHIAINSNLKYFEDLGIPPIIMNFDTDDEKELTKVLNQVLSLRSQSAGVFPQEATVKLLEGKAGKTEFLSFVKQCDSWISRYVLGNTLSGSGGESGGSYALGEIHDERRKDIQSYDLGLIAAPLQMLLEMVAHESFASYAEFELKFDDNDTADEEKLATTYEKIDGMGYDIPEEHMRDIFNIPGLKKRKGVQGAGKEKNGRQELNATTTPLDAIDAFLQSESYRKKGEEFDTRLQQTVDSLLRECNSYEEVLERLTEKYNEVELEKLEEVMTQRIANSTLKGVFDA